MKWVYSNTFKLPHPSAEYSGSENGHIREKIDLHTHWMSDSRQSIIYKRMCKLQKYRIYPKSQVKNIGEGCCKLEIRLICPKQNFRFLRALVLGTTAIKPYTCLKIAAPTVLGVRARGPCVQPHRRCLPLTGSDGNATMLQPTVR